MTEDEHTDLHNRVEAMSESERVALDPICAALRYHQESNHPDRPYSMPNRIVALSAVDLMWVWEKMMWDRE